ncbi:propanediol dehydratase, partial [Acinetobacter baumannii]|nr:propanediol dehydratase [Acinetobacter baumannii]
SYASRGLKMRFTSGSGSEVQMGYAEGKSMLYLEARCIYITKAAGVQGLQNGSVSCIGVPSAVPSGIRAVLAENLICSSLDLECASSNDQTFT